MFFLCVFLFEVFFLFFFEKKIWGTYFTPLNFLSLPYTLVTLVAIVYSYASLGVPDFYFPSLIVWMVGLFFFFIPSLFFSFANKNKEFLFQICVGKKDDNYRLLTVIALVCIAISMSRIHSVVSLSGMSFGSDEFSEEYEVKGVLAHLSVLMSAIFAYMVYKADARHKFAYIVILLALVGMYAVGVKSWIIAPFLIGYFARIVSGKTTFSFKSVLLPVLACILIFVLSYFILMVVSGKSELSSVWFTFVTNHFIDYLSGGALALSLDIKAGILEPEMTEALFTPVINIFNFVFGGEYLSSLNPIFLSIGDLGETNVRTFMGTIWVYSQNIFSYAIIVNVFGTFFYLLYSYLRFSSNIFMLLANCGNFTFLALGFFDFYWLTLGAYEIILILLLLYLMSRLSLRNVFKIKKE